MSDNDQEQEVIIIQAPIPPQISATDTSNQDEKVSSDPSGEKYIRTLDQSS